MRFFRFVWLRRKPAFFGIALTLLILGAAAWITLDRLEERGQRFFATGRGAVEILGRLANALKSDDFAVAESLYSPDFQGSSLGLGSLRKAGEKDGIETSSFTARPGALDRRAALGEWRVWLGGFESLEEIGLHLHRVEDWEADGEVTAQVRFEAIAIPRGRKRPGIERALFRMRLEPTREGLKIREASLLEGERLASDAPQFTEIGKEAGIAFANRFYKGFFDQRLRFAMIRYGPGGISAADFDNDSFYDLFIPDGVESRLFRNRRDGGFEDVTAAAGLSGLDGVSVGVFADYDNDGWKDLFVSRTFRPNQLFHNRGDGTFEDVTARSGIG
ncbi:MAG TPA: VCBS repeat-containing protein, partial [Thermoanaerobaculia bacterium]|nr:VCBS repeat-containing protein [Thermoanaerobaculia bacterium]